MTSPSLPTISNPYFKFVDDDFNEELLDRTIEMLTSSLVTGLVEDDSVQREGVFHALHAAIKDFLPAQDDGSRELRLQAGWSRSEILTIRTRLLRAKGVLGSLEQNGVVKREIFTVTTLFETWSMLG